MRRLIPALLACAALSCTEGDRIIDIDDRTGTVTGLAYVDRNADDTYTPGTDAVAPGVVAALLLDATGDTIAHATAEADGSFILRNVPIGRYRLAGVRGTLGDSLHVQHVADAVFSLAANDTVDRRIQVGYPPVTTVQARFLPAGRRVIIDGIALNAWSTFGDSSMHIADDTGSVRAVRVQQTTAQAGDSIRVLAVTGTQGGSFVLTDASIRVLTLATGLPPIDSLSTFDASRALDGFLADGQARVADAIVTDTSRVGGDLVLGVDDGSGRLEVLLESAITFGAGPFAPGATFSGSGVLTAAGNGWRLRPRSADEVVISFPDLTIAEARASAAGLRVIIRGVSLNNWNAYGDSTVHVQDATGYMRAVRVLSPVAAGDSVRLLGTVALQNGQPVLREVTPSVMRVGVGIAAPDSISTAAAAAASGGTRDAALVRIAGPIVAAQTLANGDIVLGVNDGSGLLNVVLDASINFTAAQFQAGSVVTATGLLVPAAAGSWELRPRSTTDASATFPTVSIADARGMDVGKTVFIHGVALNARVTFGDNTVHVSDATGVMRTIGVPQVNIFAGDSIRILGTIAMRNGQPVLNASSAAVLLANVGVPAIDSVTTAIAASAENGARDADHVAVSGVISATEARQGGDVAVTLSDGSGDLVVLLDADVGFATGNYAPGTAVRVRGVLVPSAAGTSWELKPRATNEISINAP